MTSMAPIPAEQHNPKPSFAKVAASSYKPQNMKENSTTQNAVPTQQRTVQIHPSVSSPSSTEPPTMRGGCEDGKDTSEKAGSTANRTGQWANAAGQDLAQAEPKSDDSEKQPPAITLVKSLATEDSGTQLSSSDGSAKPPSLDGKSVASATTFAMDEKESLRPDDSASLRAVEEEDVTSPPDSVAAGSRVGSDSGVRAFHDQLHEIGVLGAQAQRGAPPGRFPNLHANSPHALYDPSQPQNVIGRPMSQPVVNGMPNVAGSHNIPAVPDEKLIEALESPRDRLFVLKLEQDFIDFIKDSRETVFVLPNCNAFYRMLAHRLADYYLLGHTFEDAMSGVKISRTAFCRIPPPLSGLPVSSKNASTPPVDLQARKIMRRGEDGKSGTNTTANSEGPSKTTSEVGGASGSDGGNDANDTENKEKSALTREEREARYREARQRIFGDSENGEGDSAETSGSAEAKDVSRSSSASGRKKNKKQRNYDDDFEARSRFNAYYPQQYLPGYNGDQTMYYGGYTGQMQGSQYPGMNSTMPSQPNYGGAYPVMLPADAQAQYGWNNQQYPSANTSMGYSAYVPTQNGYDLSADFQRGMQSFQSAGLPSQMTPKMANAPMATYQEGYQTQPMPVNGGWAPMNQQPYSGPGFPQNSPTSRPMSAPMNGPMGQYPYGQFPTSPYNGLPNRNQHPLPGSYNRQQFNPQSQAFIPGGRSAPYQMQSGIVPPPGQGMNGYNSYQMSGANQTSNQIQNASPPVAGSQTFGSPAGTQSSNPAIQSQTPQTTSQTVVTPSPSGSSSTSVPAQSSIAKWGTPSHLPPKPPAPAQQQPPKFTLPGTNSYALPRLSNTLSPGGPTHGPGANRGSGSGMVNMTPQ